MEPHTAEKNKLVVSCRTHAIKIMINATISASFGVVAGCHLVG